MLVQQNVVAKVFSVRERVQVRENVVAIGLSVRYERVLVQKNVVATVLSVRDERGLVQQNGVATVLSVRDEHNENKHSN